MLAPKPIGLDDRLPDDAPWAATMPPRRDIGQRFPAKQPDLLVPSAEQHTSSSSGANGLLRTPDCTQENRS